MYFSVFQAQGNKLAEQHYHLQLKRKVWAGWHSLIQNRWRERVERACCARAEDVCMQLSTDYEAKMAQVSETHNQILVKVHYCLSGVSDSIFSKLLDVDIIWTFNFVFVSM